MGLFSRSFPARCALFRAQKPCIRGRMLSFRAGVRAFPCAGAALLSLGGLPSSPRVGLLGASRCTFASLCPQLGARPPLRLRSWRGCGKSAPISTYPQFVFHRLVHPVEKLFTTPCVFLPRLSLFPPQGTPSPSRPAAESAPRARVYIYRSRERRKGQRAVRRLSLWKREARCVGG